MLLTESLLGSSSTAANYIEDYFSTYLYKGAYTLSSPYSQTVTNGLPFIKDEATYVQYGTFSWVVPTGVTSISVVCVGGGGGGAKPGGGGGGGGLSYINNLSVTPGETLTVVVGAGGAGRNSAASGGAGGASSLSRGGTTLVRASGGSGGALNGAGGAGGTATTGTGYTGGTGGAGNSTSGGGGGGAAGYAGNGGNGGTITTSGTAGSGGGGGGGSGGASSGFGYYGGGVAIYGQGANGTAGTYPSNGGRGSGAVGEVYRFGGGGSGGSSTNNSGSGGDGAVRIIWSGASRQFPSTGTASVYDGDSLVWIKNRSTFSFDHALYDTVRGPGYYLSSNQTAAQTLDTQGLLEFTTDGFTVYTSNPVNSNTQPYTSWTFRKQAKFFDVVTFTSNATRGATFNHNLGSSPGCVIIKRTDGSENWWVWHRTFTSGQYIALNLNGTSSTGAPTLTASSTQIVLSDLWLSAANANYVAYLFAHDAGGFGASGADNVITCGNYTGNGSTTGPVVTLGYEPQWLLIKCTNSGTTDWNIIDNMRGFVVGGTDAELNANAAAAETTGTYVTPTATGFQLNTTDTSYNTNNGNYIYIAIRRGPMRTPTTGTSVFSPIASSAATGTKLTTIFPVDAQIFGVRTGTTNKMAYDRLRGISSNTTESGRQLVTMASSPESALGNETLYWDNTGFQMPPAYGSTSTIFWNFRRAPGFFDQVCYTGTGANTTQTHNLGVVPELMIVKGRSGATAWQVYASGLANTEYLVLNTTAAKATGATRWNSTTPTSTVFSLGTASEVNTSSATYVAYLFATVAGVSKVGSYTGSGTTKQIDCGFTGGARFVLIKRTDSTGDWYVWDSARGIVAGNDPYLLLNSTAAEVTNTDYIDTYSAGFEISSTAPAAINASGGTFIFLAIA